MWWLDNNEMGNLQAIADSKETGDCFETRLNNNWKIHTESDEI